MASKIDSALHFQQQALGLRAYRQQVLAGNIANVDTPHFKARDFDFAAALEGALAGRREGDLELSRTHARHIEGTLGDGLPNLMWRVPTQDAADGNTVEMDVERSAFTDNAIRYDAGISFITHQIKLLTSSMQSSQGS